MIFYFSMKSFIEGGILIKESRLRDLPLKVRIWSYIMVFVPILCIPTYAIYKLIITPGRNFDEVNKIKYLIKDQVFSSV